MFFDAELTREALITCINLRHHFATIRGPSGRIRIDLSVSFGAPATLYYDDPAVYETAQGSPCSESSMGDILHLPSGDAHLKVSVSAAVPIRCIDLFNGLGHMKCFRPYEDESPGNRIGVVWPGAEYCRRFQAVLWDGAAVFSDSTMTSVKAINFFNRDKAISVSEVTCLSWQSVATGNFSGFIATLKEGAQSRMTLKTPLISEPLSRSDIVYDDTVLDTSGILPTCRKRAYRS